MILSGGNKVRPTETVESQRGNYVDTRMIFAPFMVNAKSKLRITGSHAQRYSMMMEVITFNFLAKKGSLLHTLDMMKPTIAGSYQSGLTKINRGETIMPVCGMLNYTISHHYHCFSRG